MLILELNLGNSWSFSTESNSPRRRLWPNALRLPSMTRNDLCESAFRLRLRCHEAAGAIRRVRICPSLGSFAVVPPSGGGVVDRQTWPASIDHRSVTERFARTGARSTATFWRLAFRAAIDRSHVAFLCHGKAAPTTR